MFRLFTALLKQMLICSLMLSLVPAFASITPPELAVTLDSKNRGESLHIPSDGDGMNVAVSVGGGKARRMIGEGAQYLYVAVKNEDYRSPRDLYVTIEAFDDTYSRISIEYDKAGPQSNLATRYMVGEGSLWLTDAGGWRRGVFFLPAARLGGGQNFGADFRFVAKDVAIRKITVSPRPPAGYDFARPVDLPPLDALSVARPAGLHWTLGNDASAEDAAVYKALSATGVQSYVDWDAVEPRRGEWDWSRWDRQAAILKAADLQWVPFLIAGPAYATPLWFQQNDDAQPFRCLEHGKNSAVQSIFNPALRPAVQKFILAFAARYHESGVVGSVLLGITGIYGESLYPAGPEGGWTTRLSGDYHNHAGWWAGDAHAILAFRAAMQHKYPSLAALNRAWSTQYSHWSQVKPSLPATAPSDRARADFVEWYQDAMTEWASFWAKTAREAWPHTPIYLVTGGSGTPQLGADFTAQGKTLAPYKVGLRITNEHNDYASNFALTREVVTATRHYGTFVGIEPAGNISHTGQVARVYNAVTSGAREMHDYAANFTTNAASLTRLRAALPYLAPRHPRVQAALYVSRESWALQDGSRGDATEQLYALARSLRDLTDWDFVTRTSVIDGVLREARVLLLCQSPVLEPAAASAMEKWVQNGGILIASSPSDVALGSRLYDNAAWRARMFADAPAGAALLRGNLQHGEKHIRSIGRGYTIYLPGADATTLLATVQSLLLNTSDYLPGVRTLVETDGKLDGKYDTLTTTGIVRFDSHAATITSLGK